MTTRNQRGPRTILVALAVGPMLAMSVIGSAPPAAAKAPTPGDLAKLHAAYPDFATVDSGKAQTEAGVKGQVRIGSASRAVGAGVAVLIYEWPSRAVLAKQKVGTSLALTPLAAT